jgi:hypothetical protein
MHKIPLGFQGALLVSEEEAEFISLPAGRHNYPQTFGIVSLY